MIIIFQHLHFELYECSMFYFILTDIVEIDFDLES